MKNKRKEPNFIHIGDLWILKPGKYVLKKPLQEYIDEREPTMIVVGSKFYGKFKGAGIIPLVTIYTNKSVFCFNDLKWNINPKLLYKTKQK